MKKILPIIICLVAIVAGIAIFSPDSQSNSYIRIHIRANSNSKVDQDIKYAVKDSVVAYITPLADSIDSFESMYSVLNANLDNIKGCVDNKLEREGFSYRCNIRLNQEDFPTRTYEDLTLGGGIYDALIIELGQGIGDNWWCVAYPPLCFNQEGGDQKPQYKSIFHEWFNKK